MRSIKFLVKYSILAALVYSAITVLRKDEYLSLMFGINPDRSYGVYDFFVFTLSLYIFLAIILLYIRFMHGDKLKVCPKCKSFFAMKEISKVCIDTRNISVMVKSHDRNRNGEITATREQYVPGIEEKFRVKECCRFCKKEFVFEAINKKPIL